MDGAWVIVIVLVIIAVWCLVMKSNCQKCNEDFTTGYAVTSGLAYNNRLAYCQPGQDKWGGSWSGGCFLPHSVLI